MADANYILPLITAVGTVVASITAAVITGFAAAARKHKWDVQDNDVRWERERAERRRDELRTSFASYLSARYRLDFFDPTGTADAEQVRAGIREVMHAYSTTYYALSVILPDSESKKKLQRDFEVFLAWIDYSIDKRRRSETPTGSPAAGEIIDMAHELLGEVA